MDLRTMNIKTMKWVKAANNYLIAYITSILLNAVLCFLLTTIESEYVLEPLSNIFVLNFVLFEVTIYFVSIILFFGGFITFFVEYKKIQNKKQMWLKMLRFIIFPIIEYILKSVSREYMEAAIRVVNQYH